MTYEVHITRRESWADADGPKVTREEWLRFVEGDDTFTLSAGGGPSAIWGGHPDHLAGRDREGVLFLFSDWSGWLSVDQPDEVTIEKMVEVAEGLAAKVRGDDGEVYERDGDRIVTLHLGAPVRFAPGEAAPAVGQADGPLHREARRGDPDAPKKKRGLLRRAAGRVADRVTRKILG